MFVYKVKETSLREFRKLDDEKDPWGMVGPCVKAALVIKNKIADLKEWDGNGEYWFAPLLKKEEWVVIVRPESNPFAAGFCVSPVELPWLEKSEGEEI